MDRELAELHRNAQRERERALANDPHPPVDPPEHPDGVEQYICPGCGAPGKGADHLANDQLYCPREREQCRVVTFREGDADD